MSTRTDTFVIDQSLPSERLDAFLRIRFPAVSRGTIQRLIEEGAILIDGQKTKPTHHPRAGETVSVHWPQPKPLETLPEEIPLDILHEDEALLVLNKPPGLVVHPSAGHEEHTLVNALLHHCRGQLSGIGGVARPGIVHRLDKDTSGCMVVAKSDPAHQALAQQFLGREIRKVYDALVCGVLPRDHGDITAAIARHPSHRKRMAVTEGGRDAWTSYHVRERFHDATWAEALLHTGRTHQIRVHFQHLGHPLVGDTTYGSRQNRKLEEAIHYKAPRQMLHARELTFTHPISGRTLTFTAPMPEDFYTGLATLRSRGLPS